jgi:hypothetical protein
VNALCEFDSLGIQFVSLDEGVDTSTPNGRLVFGIFARKRHYDIPTPRWTCPYGGYIHVSASLLRLDSENLQCRQCWQAFPPVSDSKQSTPLSQS